MSPPLSGQDGFAEPNSMCAALLGEHVVATGLLDQPLLDHVVDQALEAAHVGVLIVDGGQDQAGGDADLLDRGEVERRGRRHGSDDLVALAALLDGSPLALGVARPLRW